MFENSESAATVLSENELGELEQTSAEAVHSMAAKRIDVAPTVADCTAEHTVGVNAPILSSTRMRAVERARLSDLSDACIEENFAELQRAAERIELERLRHLAELDRRRNFERDGYLSAAAWLADRCKVSWGTATQQVRTGRALDEMPQTRAAAASGDLSLSAARVLIAARDTDPEAFVNAESALVEAATRHSIRDLRRVTSYWRQAVEAERRGEEDSSALVRRRLHASMSLDGTVVIDGELDAENGECVLTALRAVGDADVRGADAEDARTPAQRRADALGEVCRQWLDLADRPRVGGERPHITVTVDASALAPSGAPSGADEDVGRGVRAEKLTSAAAPTRATRRCALDHTGPAPVEMVRRLACDASVMRLILAAPSEPLDVGRRTPVVPPAMRRAVVCRDATCRFPGCDRPHTWCDVHHVVHWADGGETSVANLVLLCRRHHRIVHARGGFRLEMRDGRPEFRRPDGSLVGRSPPDR